MPTECAHATCRNLKVKGNGVSFHHFPKNPERRKRWASLMGRPEGWAPSQWDLVCGAHFREEDFDKTGQTIRLREGVEPSLFDTSSHRKKRLKTQKTGKNRKRLCGASSDSRNAQDSAGLISAKSQRLNKVKDSEAAKSDNKLQHASSGSEGVKQHSLGLTSAKPHATKKCNHQDTADSDEQIQLVSSDSENKQRTEKLTSAKPQTPNKLKKQKAENSVKQLHSASSHSNIEEECLDLASPKPQTSNECNHEETMDSGKPLPHASSDSDNDQHSVSLTKANPEVPNNLKPLETTGDGKQLCHASSTSKKDQYFLKLPPDKPQTPKFHTYSADTEKTFKTKWLRAEKRAEELEKQLHNSLKREKRRKTLLAALTEELKDKNSLIDKLQAKLDLYADFPIDLFVAKSAYTEEQKEFAVTLHHYGPKAYEYLQTKVKLPTTRTVRRWLSDKDGPPPVHSSVIDALKAKIEQNKNSH